MATLVDSSYRRLLPTPERPEMRRCSTLPIVLLLLCALVHPALAQQGDGDQGATKKTIIKPPAKKGKEKEKAFARLPKPFEDIKGNAHTLADQGLFEIKKVKYGYIGGMQLNGIVWTLKARKPVTYRRALIFFRGFRDARFFYKGEETGTRVLIHSTVLEFPPHFRSSASASKQMLVGEELDVWVPLTDIERRRIVGQDANNFELRRVKLKK